MPVDLNLGAAFNTGVAKTLLPWIPTGLQITQDDGTLVKASDVASPLDRQATVKVTNTRIANVYNTLARGSIPLGNQGSNVSGQSLFVELNVVASKVVGTQVVHLPMVSRIEVRLPNDGDLTNADITSLILANFAVMHNSAGSLQAINMMRGVMLPSRL